MVIGFYSGVVKSESLKKRVLIAIQRFAVGGAETQALILAEFLQEKGYVVWVGAFGDELGEGLLRFKEKGIATIHWDFQEKLVLNPEPTLKGRGLKWRSIIYLILKVRKLKVDVIFPFTYPPNLIFCSYFHWMGAKKCFWNQRDMGINFSNKNLEVEAINRATGIISNGNSGKTFLQKFTKRPISIIHNGIDCKDYNIQAAFKKDSIIRIVKVGNLHGNKDHLTVLRAWKKVLDSLGGKQQVELLFAGKFLNTYEEIRGFIDHNDLNQSVKLLGEVSNIPLLLSTCDIAVFSSKAEGLPNGILEPMAARLPVVATQIEGSMEALGKDYPFLFDGNSIDDLVEYLLKLIRNQELRQQIGNGNQERVETNFSKSKMGNAFMNLLEN
jgi:glycosyltransferase involved in cell wall biosynthesis